MSCGDCPACDARKLQPIIDAVVGIIVELAVTYSHAFMDSMMVQYITDQLIRRLAERRNGGSKRWIPYDRHNTEQFSMN